MSTGKYTDSVSRKSAEWVFRGAMSYIPIHNYLIRAYHNANMYAFAPPERLMWQIPAIVVPAKVRRSVDAEALALGIKWEIAEARRAVEGMRASLDRGAEQLVCHSPDRPYDHLHASVIVTHEITPGYAPAWRYEFNPYLLATAILDEYEQLIDAIMHRRLAPFTQLARICQKAKMLGNSMDMVAREMMWP